MIRGLFFALVVLAALAYPRAASATACTVPNLVVNGQYVDATKLAANFSALAACSSSIDNTNIGAAGIYASQIIPTTVAQAVFGGTQSYTFSNGLTVTGTLTLTGNETQTGNQTTNGTLSVFGSTAALPVITASAGSAGTVLAGNGFTPTASGAFGATTSGSAIGWNLSGGTGETDFYNGFAGGSSTSNAFCWYYENTTSAPYTQTQTMCNTRNGQVTAANGFSTTATDYAGGLVVSGTTASAQLSVSGQSNLNGLAAASPAFSGTTATTAIANSGLIATGSFNDSGAAVFGASGYVQVSSLTPSQCVNTASNDVLGSQPCNYFTLNGLQPSVSLTSTGNTISITPSGSTIDLENLYTYTLPSSVVKSNTANNEVMVHGTATANNAGSTVGGLPFTSSSTYDCTISPTGSSSQTWTPILNKTNGATITLYNNPSITVTYICLGH